MGANPSIRSGTCGDTGALPPGDRGRVRGDGAGTAAAVDITEIILSQHHDQRRAFAQLDEIDPADTAALSAVWNRLQVLLEVHAEAEERFFYPVLLRVGHGPGTGVPGDAGAEDEGPDDEV